MPPKQIKIVHPTLADTHQKLMDEYSVIESETIPRLKEERIILKQQLLKNNSKIDDAVEIRDRIQEITNEIRRLKQLKRNYLLENSRDIFEFFDEKQKIATGNNSINKKKFSNFFKIVDTTTTTTTTEITERPKNNYQKYWEYVQGDISGQTLTYTSDNCSHCNFGELIQQDDEGIMICNHCGHYVNVFVDKIKHTNKDNANEVSYTAYIPLNHFKEILSQFQAKESTQIPTEVIEKIRSRLKKERIASETITKEIMKEVLRRLGLTKYFEHTQYIILLICGISPPTMSDKLVETLCMLFIETQGPWSSYCPPTRNNFFGYMYVLYQLLVLLDQKQYLPYISLLKSDMKERDMDKIWELVCRDLDWQFFPTV